MSPLLNHPMDEGLAQVCRGEVLAVLGPIDLMLRVDVGFGIELIRNCRLFNLSLPDPTLGTGRTALEAMRVRVQDLLREPWVLVMGYQDPESPGEILVSVFFRLFHGNPHLLLNTWQNLETMLVEEGHCTWKDPTIDPPSLTPETP